MEEVCDPQNRSRISDLADEDSGDNGEKLLELCSGQFNAASDGEDEESEDDELEISFVSNRKNQTRRPIIEDDDSNLANDDNLSNVGDDDTEVSDEDDEENSEKSDTEITEKRNLAKAFVDDEAELSGEEGSADEDEDQQEDEIIADEGGEDVPSEDELREQIGKFHNKQLLDDDKRELLMCQERFLEDGDLHSDAIRQRKFRWKNIDHNALQREDSDDSDASSVDDGQIEYKTIKLKQLDLPDEDVTYRHSLRSTKTIPLHAKSLQNSIANFIVKDERLMNFMSNKRFLSENKAGSTKKRKENPDDEQRRSVFDFLPKY